ncbi:hypothetical protein IPL68_06035 [Candidatus Saccharibacteria bacterium]|nr:MAG: hypothetical protein IPL68_06035 [Candidatus Saccharibacteria bacterium]
MIDLGTTSTTLAPWYPANIMNFSTVLPNSTTAPGTSPCLPQLSMCMRDVDWNPTGSSFVLCTTGGGGTSVYPSLRDSISLWPNSNSTNATPDWVNYTDNDTFLSCRATTNYIYTGGHFRNLNFTVYRAGVKQTSAAYAPQTHYGIGAINASTGSAVASFNQGTSTGRGYGWAGMYVSPASQGAGAGLWVGGDADGIMGENHRRLGLFPL